MIRRLVAVPVVAGVLGLLSLGLAVPAEAAPARSVSINSSSSPWFCIAIAELNFGYCQYDPLG